MNKKLKTESEIDFRVLFENAPALFLVLEPDAPRYTITAVSEQYLEATMQKRASMIGKGLFEVFPDNPDDPAADGSHNLKISLKRVLQNKASDKMQVQKYDIPRSEENGGGFETRYWEPLNSPIIDENGKVSYIIHRVVDVTKNFSAEKKSGELMKIAMIELEEKSAFIEHNQQRLSKILETLLRYIVLDFSEKISISEKGDELDAIVAGLNTLSEELESHIQMLKDSSSQLSAVNKELESFSYSVSHDLRSPLRAIDGYARIMEEDYDKVLDDEGKRLLGVIQYNARRMGTLIDDLLAFSRLGKKELVRSAINMKELIEGAIGEVSKAMNNRASISFGQLLTLKADYSLINQVLVNFISNAIKYSSKSDEPKVHIASEAKDGQIIYAISDNGVGFNMDYSHKLFGVFQRLHSMEDFEGTGVGLAIVQRVITKHGGKVWAESELGKGATFYFSIPEN
ncbi:MAG: ATP-binding protein [Bacteroidia bacterium]